MKKFALTAILFALISSVPDHAEARARRHSDANGNPVVPLGPAVCGCALKLFLVRA